MAEQEKQPKKDVGETKVNKTTAPEEEKTERQEKQKTVECVPKEEYIKLKYQFSQFVSQTKEMEREFENYRRRTKEEMARMKDEGTTKAIKALLPALDSFKKAKKIITDKSSLNGIDLIEKSLMTELEKLGVKKIHCKGKKFDMELHNAIAMVEDEKAESGTVIEEVEAGYTLKGEVVKFCQVIVAK